MCFWHGLPTVLHTLVDFPWNTLLAQNYPKYWHVVVDYLHNSGDNIDELMWLLEKSSQLECWELALEYFLQLTSKFWQDSKTTLLESLDMLGLAMKATTGMTLKDVCPLSLQTSSKNFSL
jgi:hypothetical protein